MRTRIKNAFSAKINTIGLPILALCWVSFFWGTTWIASKEGVKHMPALQLAAIRQFIGGFLYIAYFLWKKTPWPKGKQWKFILILSVLNFVLSNGLSTWGVKFISSGLGAIIGALVPLWVVIISFFRGERLAKVAILGLIIGFSGICVVFYDHLSDFFIADFRFGIFLSIAATLTWAFGTLYTKKKAASFNPYFSLGIQMFISSIFLFAYLGATGSAVSLSTIPVISWVSIGYLVIFGSVLTFIAYIYALQNLPAEINSIYAYINPIVAIILGTVFLKEAFNWNIPIAVALIISGIICVNWGYKAIKKNAQ